MLQIEIKSLMHARGAHLTQKLLMTAGIAQSTASKLLNGKPSGITFHHIEILCKLLHCTPNDLLVYKPDNGASILNDPLKVLRSPGDNYGSLVNALHDLEPGKIKEVLKVIEGMKGK